MKKKEKKRILEEIVSDINPKHEAILILSSESKGGEYYAKGNMDFISNGIAEILRKGIAGKEGSQPTKIAWSILGALRQLQDDGIDIEELLTAFDDDENDNEDCLSCELFNVCGDERAIALRKEIGIQRHGKVCREIEIN